MILIYVSPFSIDISGHKLRANTLKKIKFSSNVETMLINELQAIWFTETQNIMRVKIFFLKSGFPHDEEGNGNGQPNAEEEDEVQLGQQTKMQ
jgi:hypothetical protein